MNILIQKKKVLLVFNFSQTRSEEKVKPLFAVFTLFTSKKSEGDKSEEISYPLSPTLLSKHEPAVDSTTTTLLQNYFAVTSFYAQQSLSS